MSTPSAVSAVIYTGNGSTSTPYLVPFGYLEKGHVQVAVKTGSTTTLLVQGVDYTLTPTTDSQGRYTGGSITTAVAYNSSYTVTVFRQPDLIQPLVLPDTGSLNVAAVEAALDRCIQLCQWLHRRVLELEGNGDGGSVVIVPQGATGQDAFQDVATFADATARAAATPRRAGQLGVQLSDGSLYRSTSTSVGAWTLVQTVGPGYTATSATNSVAIASSGSKTLVTQSGLAYAAGARIRATDASNVANWMEGVVTSYSGTSLVFTADLSSGSGTPTSWKINLAGERGTAGVGVPSGGTTGQKLIKSSNTDYATQWL